MIEVIVSPSEVKITTEVIDSVKPELVSKALGILKRMPIVAFLHLGDCPLENIEFNEVEITCVSHDGQIQEMRVRSNMNHRIRPMGRIQPTGWGINTTYGEAPVRFQSAGSSAGGETIIRVSFEDTVIFFTI